ncbi:MULTISPECIES: hypothetical protein [Enterobacterales]|nr:hypothetical protein [Citrobacter koseri]WOI99993.1 hypothetical protein R1158_07585 [Citrobacter koseri]HCR9765997.1 hypothetical protein [Citrobacter koseri]HEM7946817.1 hypothetical protein [Citrobacter koseri]
MKKSDISIIFDENIPAEFFKDFENDVEVQGLNLVIESREPTGPMACAEWFILPVVFAFIGKSYFDGFLKEMGKDHYQSMKESLSNLTTKVMKTPRVEPTLFSTKGKISSRNPFSLAFSILAEAEDGYTFKLLIPKTINGGDYSVITNEFMDFLSDYHLGFRTLESIGYVSEEYRPPSDIIFVHYNPTNNSIEWLNEKNHR